MTYPWTQSLKEAPKYLLLDSQSMTLLSPLPAYVLDLLFAPFVYYLSSFLFLFSHLPLLVFHVTHLLCSLQLSIGIALTTILEKALKLKVTLSWAEQVRCQVVPPTRSHLKKEKRKRKEAVGSEEASSGHLVITDIKLRTVQLVWSHKCIYHYSQTVC